MSGVSTPLPPSSPPPSPPSRLIAAVLAGKFEPLAKSRLRDGNRLRWFASASPYFDALVEAIAGARHSVNLETYIFADDRVGRRVIDALVGAAARGVQVRVLIDGYGGGDFAQRLVRRLAPQGVAVRIYRPAHWWRPQRHMFRRLHRKIVVIDDRIAFVGGINVNDDPERDEHDGDRIGPRLDVAVQCEGPIVAAVAHAVHRLWWSIGVVGLRELSEPPPPRPWPAPPEADGVRAAFLLRDSFRNRHTIERSYLAAIRLAKNEILLANAYFLPGRRFRHALIRAVRRGVRVRLLLQGRIEYPIQYYAQRALYGQLLDAGIEIFEYRDSYLHAKVAVVDEDWATVGSSNIDPLSLLLAREANVLVRDAAFAQALRNLLESAIRNGSQLLHARRFSKRSRGERVIDWVNYGIVRLATILLARGNDY